MAGPQTSPTETFYTLSLEPPQELRDRARRLKRYLESRDMAADPTPPAIVLTRSRGRPSPPVTGRLPRCESAPQVRRRPAIENGISTTDKPWLTWPVDLGPWYAELRESLISRHPSDEEPLSLAGTPPDGSFILLACFRDNRIDPADLTPILRNEETESLFSPAPGWRSLKLCCRRIDIAANRSWYLSAYWRTLWTRRLRRAPKAGRRPT